MVSPLFKRMGGKERTGKPIEEKDRREMSTEGRRSRRKQEKLNKGRQRIMGGQKEVRGTKMRAKRNVSRPQKDRRMSTMKRGHTVSWKETVKTEMSKENV